MRLFVNLAVAGLGVAAAANIAAAAVLTTTLNTTNTGDAVLHVSNAFAPTTAGNYNYIGLYQGTPMEVLIHFDLPTLPVGAVINSATLRMNLISNADNNSGASMNVSAYAVLKNWTLSEVNWTNSDATHTWSAGGLGSGTDRKSTPVATIDLQTIDTYQDFDITSQYLLWASNTETNNGLLIIPNNPVGFDRLQASEYGPPDGLQLVVDYTPVPEPTVLGLGGLALLLIQRRRGF